MWGWRALVGSYSRDFPCGTISTGDRYRLVEASPRNGRRVPFHGVAPTTVEIDGRSALVYHELPVWRGRSSQTLKADPRDTQAGVVELDRGRHES